MMLHGKYSGTINRQAGQPNNQLTNSLLSVGMTLKIWSTTKFNDNIYGSMSITAKTANTLFAGLDHHSVGQRVP